jgi:hypothetical protein
VKPNVMARSNLWWGLTGALFVAVCYLILSAGHVGHDVVDHSSDAHQHRDATPAPRTARPPRRAVSTPTPPQDDSADDSAEGSPAPAKRRAAAYVQPLLPSDVLELYNTAPMINVNDQRVGGDAAAVAPHNASACRALQDEKESTSNEKFAMAFGKIFRERFPPAAGGAPDGSGLHWMLDEGGLIGASRAGAMRNADDDFDFFALLPNQHAPCRAGSLTCTEPEYHAFIHKFLMTFWDAGWCINKFHPDPAKFKARRRLMYSLQLNRDARNPNPLTCFSEQKPFAHMHLAMFNDKGLLKTNIWAHGTTHPMDELPLSVLLPVQRCRAGAVDAPCPHRIVDFLTLRNRGEYRKYSSDGSCLLVRSKWGMARKVKAVQRTRDLAACGYATMVSLADDLVGSGYKRC